MYDMKHLAKLESLAQLAPDSFKAFMAFDQAVIQDGAISRKNKELIAIAVALTTQCPYCIQIHADRAKQAGATEKEIAEVALVAAALRAGAAITHATHALQ